MERHENSIDSHIYAFTLVLHVRIRTYCIVADVVNDLFPWLLTTADKQS